MMPGFDIASLVSFQPPKYLCERCLGLLTHPPIDSKSRLARCPVCNLEYIATDEYSVYQVENYLASQGYSITFPDPLVHCKALAQIGNQLRRYQRTKGDPRPGYPLLLALLESLRSAQQFVHFTTFGMSHILLGALKLAARRIDIRGVVAGADESIVDELTNHKAECPRLAVKVFSKEVGFAQWNSIPHQELVVIDGIMAFKGSANLTTSAWRKAAQDREFVEIVTELDDVRELNNRFFSPVWIMGDDTATIETSTSPF